MGCQDQLQTRQSSICDSAIFCQSDLNSKKAPTPPPSPLSRPSALGLDPQRSVMSVNRGAAPLHRPTRTCEHGRRITLILPHRSTRTCEHRRRITPILLVVLLVSSIAPALLRGIDAAVNTVAVANVTSICERKRPALSCSTALNAAEVSTESDAGTGTEQESPPSHRMLKLMSPTCNLGAGEIRPMFCRDAALALLAFVTAILETHSIPYWLTQGTLLGAVRDGELIPWTNDVDISCDFRDFTKILGLFESITDGSTAKSAQDFASGAWKSFYYSIHREDFDPRNPSGGWTTRWISVTTGIVGIHLDINARNFKTHRTIPGGIISSRNSRGDIDNDDANKDDADDSWAIEGCNYHLHDDCLTGNPSIGHIMRHDIFPLRDIEIKGVVFSAPRDPYSLLRKTYGQAWRIPDRFGTGAWISDDDIHSVSATNQQDMADL